MNKIAIIALSLSSLISARNPCHSSSSSSSSSACHNVPIAPICDAKVVTEQSFNFIEDDLMKVGPGLNQFSPVPGFNQEGLFDGRRIEGDEKAFKFILGNRAYPLVEEDVLHISMNATFRNSVSGATSPLGFDEDVYYGCGALVAVDFSTGFVFDHLVTNTKIYALYNRLPIYQSPDNDYLSFSYMIPIASRKPDEYNLLTMSFNKREGTVDYLVDGRRRLRLTKVGLPIDEKFKTIPSTGSVPTLLYPNAMAFGPGALIAQELFPVCQGTTFDQCLRKQTIFNARLTNCQYAPIQDPNTYTADYSLTMSNWSIYRTSCLEPPCGRKF